jgi:membrane protein required for colicin V production
MSEYIQPYDFVMLAVLVAALAFGAWKGVAWQIAALASVIVSAAVAVHSSAALTPYLSFSDHEQWNRFLAMLVLYVATAGAIWILFRLVAGVIDRLKLKEFDRQLGATFGLAKGVLYCVVITFFVVTLSESARQTVLASRSGGLIARGIRDANPIIPDDVRTWLGKYIDELDEKLHAPPSATTPDKGVSSTMVGTAADTLGTSVANTSNTNSPAPATVPDAKQATKKKLRDYLPKLNGKSNP